MIFLRLAIYLLVWAVILFLLFLLLRYCYYQIAGYFSPERRIQRDINIALHYMEEGQINDALHIFAKHNLGHEIDRCLRESLPRGEVKELLVSASEQLVKLKHALPRALNTGVPEVIIEPLEKETDNAITAVFDSANRFCAVHAQEISFLKLGATVQTEIDKLERISIVSQHTRQTLAKWTILGGGDKALQEAEIGLLAFEEATRDLMELV
jgi:hypothetical protein